VHAESFMTTSPSPSLVLKVKFDDVVFILNCYQMASEFKSVNLNSYFMNIRNGENEPYAANVA
jgi:hypothetical protein